MNTRYTHYRQILTFSENKTINDRGDACHRMANIHDQSGSFPCSKSDGSLNMKTGVERPMPYAFSTPVLAI